MVFLGFALPGYGGGPASPSGLAVPPPGIPAGTVLAFRSGETDQPTVGAGVVVSGRSFTTNSLGQITVDARVDLSAPLDVMAAGFLDRQTLLRSASETLFTLWPKTSPTGLNEDFTIKVIYTSAGDGGIPAIRISSGS